MKKLKEKEKKDEIIETQEEGLRQTFLHTSMLIHTNMPHTTVILHTDSLPRQHFYTQSLLRTNTVTHKHFYTRTPLHKRFYTQKLLHSDAFNTQTPLHQKLLHRESEREGERVKMRR